MFLWRIDLALGNSLILPLIVNVAYSARSLSDHSPLILTLILQSPVPKGYWKVNPYWLTILDPRDSISCSFLLTNKLSAHIFVLWNSLRGILIAQISKINKQAKMWGTNIIKAVNQAEVRYITSHTHDNQVIWLEQQKLQCR